MGFRDYDTKWLEKQLQTMATKKDGGVNTVGGIYNSIAEFQGSYSSLTEACAAYGVGYPGIAGQQFYCDGTQLFGPSLMADANGDIFVNIVPRTNTLTYLGSVVGTQGELASATDTPAIVQYTGGTTQGGDIFRPANGYAAQHPMAAIDLLNSGVALTSHGFVASHNMNPLMHGTSGQGIAVIANAAATSIQGTFDFVNWWKIDPRAGANTPKLCVSGMSIFQTEAATNLAWVLTPPYSTWTATNPMHDTITTWSQPIPLESHSGIPSALVYDNSGISGNYSIINSAFAAAMYALPNGDVFSVGSVVTELKQGYDGKSNKLLGILAVLAGTNKYYIGYAQNGFVGTAPYTLPATITTPVVLSMADALVIYDKATNIFYVNRTIKPIIGFSDGKLATGETGNNGVSVDHTAWTTITGPTKIPVNTGTLIGNRKLACLYTSGQVLISNDLVTWKQMPSTGIVPGSAIAIPSGILFQKPAEEYVGFYANDGSIYSLNNQIAVFIANLTQNHGNRLFNFGTIGASTVSSLDPIIERKRVVQQVATAATQNIAVTTGLHECTAATSAAMTIYLPPCPYPGMEVIVKVTNVQTVLTFGTQATPANQTIKGAATWSPGANTAGQVFKFTYWSSNDWSVQVIA